MWSGPIFDHNNDGIADEIIIGGIKNANKFTPIPSHIFLILLRCSNSSWDSEGRQCEDLEQTRTLAFVLPIVEKDLNCLVGYRGGKGWLGKASEERKLSVRSLKILPENKEKP